LKDKKKIEKEEKDRDVEEGWRGSEYLFKLSL